VLSQTYFLTEKERKWCTRNGIHFGLVFAPLYNFFHGN